MKTLVSIVKRNPIAVYIALGTSIIVGLATVLTSIDSISETVDKWKVIGGENATNEFRAFSRPGIIASFHYQDKRSLSNNIIESYIYATTISNFVLSDMAIFIAEDKAFLKAVDPELPRRLAMAMASDKKYNQQIVEFGLSSIFAPLQVMAESRESGASLLEESQAMQKSIIESPSSKVSFTKEIATHDAKTLVLTFSGNPEFFIYTYGGIKAFVEYRESINHGNETSTPYKSN